MPVRVARCFHAGRPGRRDVSTKGRCDLPSPPARDASRQRLSRVPTAAQARRKPARGGAPNALFIVAAAEALPEPLTGIADEITINYPWGSLLRIVVGLLPAAEGTIVLEGGGEEWPTPRSAK